MFNTSSRVSLNDYQIPLQQLREERRQQSFERRSEESDESLQPGAEDDQLSSLLINNRVLFHLYSIAKLNRYLIRPKD